MFVGMHATLAVLTNTPELSVSDDEGDAFMRAAQKVASHYSVQTTQKTIDWLAFMGVTANIYGTRAFAIQMRRNQEKARDDGPMGQVLRWPVKPRERRAEASDQSGVNVGAPMTEPFVPSVMPEADPDATGF